jgi:hypothetical protein
MLILVGESSDNAAVADHDLAAGLAEVGAQNLDLLHHVHPGRDLPEHDVLAVQPRGLPDANEELCFFRTYNWGWYSSHLTVTSGAQRVSNPCHVPGCHWSWVRLFSFTGEYNGKRAIPV